MVVTETIIIKVTRRTECIEQCFDDVLQEKMNIEQTKCEVACMLSKEGLDLQKGDFIHVDVKAN